MYSWFFMLSERRILVLRGLDPLPKRAYGSAIVIAPNVSLR